MQCTMRREAICYLQCLSKHDCSRLEHPTSAFPRLFLRFPTASRVTHFPTQQSYTTNPKIYPIKHA
jgi:hypothetical protein